ncbi:hypothetical protein AAFC00_003306 [Neodothiora populina]|uniref:Stress response RCI peptide n=1 Tax=Neodothiora populina TaxID=2781224 RepID=A0ABR3PA89_9PEZI
MISALLLIIITIFLPPVGVFLISGCGADLLINICLTILGYFPGHIHAFYLEYVYYHRKEQAEAASATAAYPPPPSGAPPAPGVYSDNVRTGGATAAGRTEYGTMNAPAAPAGYGDGYAGHQQPTYGKTDVKGAPPAY